MTKENRLNTTHRQTLPLSLITGLGSRAWSHPQQTEASQ